MGHLWAPRAAGERTNENRLSFFSATRFQVPFTNSRFRTRGPHSSAAKNERPFKGKSRNQKIQSARAPRFPFPLSFFLGGEESGGFKGSVSSLIHRFAFELACRSMFLTLFYVTSMQLESIEFSFLHGRKEDKRFGEEVDRNRGGKYPYFAIRVTIETLLCSCFVCLIRGTKGIVFPSSRAKVRDERGVYINVVVITLSLWHAANFVSFSKIRFSPGAIYLLNLLSLLRNNDATLVINRSWHIISANGKLWNKDYFPQLSLSVLFFFFSSFSSISSDHSNRADFHFDRGASCSNSSEFQGKWFCDWRWPERQFNFPDPQACTGLVIRLKFNPILMHDMQIPEKQAPLLRIYLDQSFKVD